MYNCVFFFNSLVGSVLPSGSVSPVSIGFALSLVLPWSFSYRWGQTLHQLPFFFVCISAFVDVHCCDRALFYHSTDCVGIQPIATFHIPCAFHTKLHPPSPFCDTAVVIISLLHLM